jgi:hypothetical protein
MIAAAFEAQCRVLCFGPSPTWDDVQARLEEIRELLTPIRLRPFHPLSGSRSGDRLARQCLLRILRALEEDGRTSSPSCPLGSSISHGCRSEYAKARHLDQAASPAPADLSPQGVWAQVPPAALEPALLPGPAMPAGGPPLAGGAAASPTSPARRRQSPACPGRTSAPAASQVHATAYSEPGSYVGAWSRSRTFFSPPLCDRPGCHEHPVSSPRNPARYCGPACRQAVRNVRDRERKWLSRGTLDGRTKRAIEYQAARRRRGFQAGHPTEPPPSRPTPQ